MATLGLKELGKKKSGTMKSGLDAMPLFLLDDLLKAFLYFWFAQNWMPNQPNLFLRPCSITKRVTRISFSDATHYITKAQTVQRTLSSSFRSQG